MKILAIDTSNWPLGVALIEDGKLIGEINTYISKNHSLRLMPAIEHLFQQTNIEAKDLNGIAVAQGPGSYTGVRIGVTTAKTLAWSLRLPILGISSLHIIAQNKPFTGLIIPMFDARRGQVYRGAYRWNELSQMAVATQTDRLQLVEQLVEEYKLSEEPLLFIGEGVEQHREVISQQLGAKAVFAHGMEHVPRASYLAHLAWKLWEHSVTDVHSFQPEYLQLAEAEANWLARQGGTC